MPEQFGYGYLYPNDSLGGYNPTAFIVAQMLSRVHTVTLAKVMAVTNTGLAVPAGTVDVQPLVSMVDGVGNATPHGTVFRLPYFRLQSGTSAIIIDPAVGDIGIMLMCDRDISAVKSTNAAAPPPSMRQFDFSDGLFIGGVLGTSAPTQSVAFTAAGIVVTGNLVVNGNLQLSGSIQSAAGAEYSGNITTSGDVTAGTVSLKTHEHSGVTTGSDPTGPPIP